MAQGAWTSVIQERIDSENYISGTEVGVYNTAQKLQEAWTTLGSATPISMMPVTVANLQMYGFTVDQGTAVNPIVVTFTSNTTKTAILSMVAGVNYYWDLNQQGGAGSGAQPYGGIFAGTFSGSTVWTPFGATISSATYNIPTALGVTTVNFTGRVASL